LKLRPSSRTSATLIALAATSAVVLSACTSTNPSADGGAIAVSSSDDTCDVASAEAPSGVVQFKVENTGSQVTEFYLLASDGLQVVGEVENIGPGLTRDLVVQAGPGTYQVACKPGMVGDGIRSAFTVTDSGTAVVPTGSVGDLLNAATVAYAAYVKDQTEQLITDTKEFADAYKAGDDDLARSLYATTRMHWEGIEPVAESFGDLDPRTDAREADLEPGQVWTGWHRIEKDLWPPADYTPLTPAERTEMADLLVSDTQELYDRSRDLQFTASQMGNGAKELLDEVALMERRSCTRG
jgi:iron uptake system component EfeO